MRVATISFNSVWEDKEANFREFERLVSLLRNKVEFVILPEMTFTGFSVYNPNIAEEIKDSSTIEKVKQVAISNGVHIIIGLMTVKKGRFFNSCVAVDSRGQISDTYEKINLFSHAGENKLISSGNKVKSLGWPGGWGLSICYDLRFPQLFQRLSENSLVLVNIANWPKLRLAHWKTLLAARAIENQSFVIGVNRIGRDANDIEYEESSFLFSPLGELVDPYEIFSNIKVYHLNLNEALECRQKFPLRTKGIENISY